MPNDIAIAEQGAFPATHVGLSDEARDFAKEALAAGTRRSYAIKLKAWADRCEATGNTAFPADPIDVANWLSSLANNGSSGGRRKRAGKTGSALSTLRIAVAALRSGHHARGMSFDTSHPAIALVLRGISRNKAEEQAQAAALTPTMLSEIVAHLTEGFTEQRDAAILAVGYSFARRRSEVCGLDWAEHGTGDGVLRIEAHRVVIKLLRSKTGADEFIVPRKGSELLVEVLKRWIEAATIKPGQPLIRAIHRTGSILPDRLDGGSVPRIVRRRVREHFERAGHDRHVATEMAKPFAGHSLRVGLAVAAAEAGADVREIQTVTGHKSAQMVLRYTAAADKTRSSPHRRDGVRLEKVDVAQVEVFETSRSDE